MSKAVSAKSLKQKQNLLKSNQDFALVASVVASPAPHNISQSRAFKKQKMYSTPGEKRNLVSGASKKQNINYEANNPYFDNALTTQNEILIMKQ